MSNTTQYTIVTRCRECGGNGYTYIGGKRKNCLPCKGTGNVERVINEVHSEGAVRK